jgi:drug/metabolite transporter (DMT)-like permease
MKKHSLLVPMLETLFAVVVWGGSFIATKIALQDVSPVTIVWLRFLIGVAVLGAAVTARKQFRLPGWRDLGLFALLGLIGITWHQWLQSTGLQTAQASTTAWIVSTTPVFMALLGWLVLKERLSALQAGGIGLAAAGVLLVVSKGDLGGVLQAGFGTPGDRLILISAPNWAVFSTLSRRGLRSHPAARMMLYVMGFGWLFSSVPLAAGPGLSEFGQLSQNGWLAVLFLGVACSGLAYIAWYDALQALPAMQVGAFLYLEPLVTMVVAAILLDEAVVWSSLAGGGLILTGVWLVNRPKKAGGG